MSRVKLKLDQLTKVFGDLMAVNDICIDIFDNEFVCILGPSGCGKTTTLNLLSGLEVPTSGNIILDDKVINKLPPQKRDIGLIFQDYALFENMNVYENLAFSMRVKRKTRDEVDSKVRKVAQAVEVSHILKKKYGSLNPGEMQRVAIGRTMISEPSVFLLDEPLDNLDADMRVTMRAELKRLQKDLGKTMIYVTHDQEEAMSLADRIVVMEQGLLQQMDSPQEIYNHPGNKFVAGFIGTPPMNFINCKLDLVSGKLMLSSLKGYFSMDVSEVGRHLYEGKVQKEVILGIRPENVSVNIDGLNGEKGGGSILRVEPLGPEMVIEVALKGDPDNVIRALVDPGRIPGVGEPIEINFHQDKIHLIDPLSEEVLI
jgi:multiple sugar transport system ATP-binding protein